MAPLATGRMLVLALVALAVEAASPDYPGHCQSPRWSPDGRLLSWEVNYLERQVVELYVTVFGQGAPPRRVVPSTPSGSGVTSGFATGPSRMVVHELSFAPPSLGKFVYSSSGSTEDYDLYIDGVGPLAAVPGADGNAAWSPDGRKIAFTSARSGQGDLYLVDLARIEAAPLRLSGDPVASELYAAWAPDSRQLAFVGHTPHGDNVYLVDNVDFPAPRPLTTWSGVSTRPTWSPDGTKLAFYSNHEDPSRFDLYTLTPGGMPARVATGVVMNARGPAWTFDSKHVVYVRDDPDNFNPVWAVPVADPSRARMLPTGTVGNGDIDVTRRADGKTWLAVAAQGRVGDSARDFRRVYAVAVALP